ncbi:MAG: hypothetical protein JST04_16060 [Bdellovibrionales bacterium]|nr:hypothetical protein [Bdellovibrionales bacterium]
MSLSTLPRPNRKFRASLFFGFLLSIAGAGVSHSAGASLFPQCALLFLPSGPTVAIRGAAQEKAVETIAKLKQDIAYPEVPAVTALSICGKPPASIVETAVSAGVADPFLERARNLGIYEDFKPISDLSLKPMTAGEFEKLRKEAAKEAELASSDPKGFEAAFLKSFIAKAYESPKELVSAKNLAPMHWKLDSGSKAIDDAFAYTERTWGKLVNETHPQSGGSLLASPYPILVPAGRFQEAYYWDSYFGIKGLLATDRLDIAQMQVENFLAYVRKYGFVPNGGRDYYLTRSQPPFLSSITREVFEATIRGTKSASERLKLKKWLRDRAYALIRKDYEDFWMNAKTRFDPKTGLNHHWDDLNIPRPERHGADNELALGKTYRDVRAGAESGLDFTDAFEGEPTKIAGPLLNSMLYKTETDLAWMADQIGDKNASRHFAEAAAKRKRAMDKYLWNAEKARYEPFHIGLGKNVDVFSADAYAPLFVGAASPEQAKHMQSWLGDLERPGGLMASDLMSSVHQWDGTNGWAPYQVMAIDGLRRYGFDKDSRRIAKKWVDALAQVHARDGAMYERIDVATIKKPDVDPHKYPTQEGFLWTNGSFVWAAVDILNYPIKAVTP